MLHAFLLLPKLIKRFFNTVTQTVSNCLGFKGNDSGPSAGGFQLNPDNIYETKLKHSSTSENSSDYLDRHINARSDIEHVIVDENVSRELINDIICDNILLKNKLEKVIVDTNSLHQKVEDICTQVKAISEVCDILVADNLNGEGKNATRNHSQAAKSKKTLLYP